MKLVASLPSPSATKLPTSVVMEAVALVNATLTSAIRPALHAPLSRAVNAVTVIMLRAVRSKYRIRFMTLFPSVHFLDQRQSSLQFLSQPLHVGPFEDFFVRAGND